MPEKRKKKHTPTCKREYKNPQHLTSKGRHSDAQRDEKDSLHTSTLYKHISFWLLALLFCTMGTTASGVCVCVLVRAAYQKGRPTRVLFCLEGTSCVCRRLGVTRAARWPSSDTTQRSSRAPEFSGRSVCTPPIRRGPIPS